MPIAHEVFIEAPPGRSASFILFVAPFIRRLLNLPGFRLLRPLARKVQAVSEPVSRLFRTTAPGSHPAWRKQTHHHHQRQSMARFS